MTFKWIIKSASDLSTDTHLQNEWDRLNENNIDQVFLKSYAVLLALHHFGNGDEKLALTYQDNTLVGMLILTPIGRFRWQTFQPSQIPLGLWVIAKYLSLEQLICSLLQGPLRFSLSVSILQIDSEKFGNLTASDQSFALDYIDTAWIDLQGNFDDYWNERGKNLRQNIKKQKSKLITDGVEVSLKITSEIHDVSTAVLNYGEIESKGWKAKKGTAVNENNSQGAFYTALLKTASLQGEAFISQYFMNGKVVAVNLCMLYKGVLVVLKTSYDESIKLYSPASLLREAEFKYFFSEKIIEKIEYFGRVMDWHTKLTHNKRKIKHLTVYRWPFLKKLAAAKLRLNTRHD